MSVIGVIIVTAQPSLFKSRIVIVIMVIYADHFIASIKKPN
jgi:hypothetical protein